MAATHTMPQRGTHVSMQLYIGGGGNMGSQMDINTCTEAFTHSKQAVGTELE